MLVEGRYLLDLAKWIILTTISLGYLLASNIRWLIHPQLLSSSPLNGGWRLVGCCLSCLGQLPNNHWGRAGLMAS